MLVLVTEYCHVSSSN